jgi:D-tyrosyl-tRNA(Tyr) deacylase
MRAVVQRVHEARVEVAGEVVGAIGRGLCAFVGTGEDDDDRDLSYVADKILNLRVFTDETGKMNRAVHEVAGSVLAVSQFTVFGDVRKGRRPSFAHAMHPTQAEPAYHRFVALLRERGLPVETGRFGADMRVVVDNDGPVTILVDSKRGF